MRAYTLAQLLVPTFQKRQKKQWGQKNVPYYQQIVFDRALGRAMSALFAVSIQHALWHFTIILVCGDDPLQAASIILDRNPKRICSRTGVVLILALIVGTIAVLC